MASEVERRVTDPSSDAWRLALATRTTRAGGVPGAAARRTGARPLVPRKAFLAGAGLAALGAAGGLLDYLWPRNVRGFGSKVAVGRIEELPAPGAPPKLFAAAQLWLVHLDATDTRENGSGGGSGLLALWRRCPHLGCAVPWTERGTPPPSSGERAWFQCPCHASTYTRAGVRVFGPAPRSMDTMRIEIDGQGQVVVDTGAITSGGVDNPQRAVPAEPGARSAV